MRYSSQFEIRVPRSDAWKALQDPAKVAAAMPIDVHLDETSDGMFEGDFKVGMGPFKTTVRGAVELSDRQPPESCHISFKASGMGASVEGSGDVRLDEIEQDLTRVTLDTDLQAGGILGRIDEEKMANAAQSFLDKFFEKLTEQAHKRPPQR